MSAKKIDKKRGGASAEPSKKNVEWVVCEAKRLFACGRLIPGKSDINGFLMTHYSFRM